MKKKSEQNQIKEHSIHKKFPAPVLNNTTTKTLSKTEYPIEVFPPEITFKGTPSSILSKFKLNDLY
jgi:hypothetical protein